MHHKLGDSPKQDSLVFERPGVADSFVGSSRLNNEKQAFSGYEYATCSIGTNPATALYLKAPGEKTFSSLFDDGKSEISPIAMIGGKLYATTNLDAPKGRLVAIDPADPAPKNWQTIVAEPDNNDILQWAFAHQGQLLVGYQHDTADRIALHKLDGTYKADMPLPVQSVVDFAKVNKDDKEYLMNISGHKSPGASYKYDIATNTLKLWKTSAAKVDLEDAVIERVQATSKDGTKVPMTIIRGKDVKLDGSAATKLYGYGGFNVPLEPGFSFGTYNWVKEGGVYAVANLRGGGEFGSEWYDDGRLLKKQNVFDDFAACAEYLIDKKYTKPARLTINGGSNGGLLTLATMLQRPELFGAVVSHVPVTDMYRFHKFTYGAFWKSDYGDIENSKADFNAAAGYSPLHNVKKNVNYPPTLVMTGDHDDRVVPSHAFKFVARMQEMARKTALCLLRVEKDAGHGAGKSKDKTITEMVEEHAFLVKTLGPINQNQYKATLKSDNKKVAGNDNGAGASVKKRRFKK
jgi:prolyl oligopeptidase